MNIIWLCNIEPPIVSKVLGKEKNVFGGWLDETANQIIQNTNNNLLILFPSMINIEGKENNLQFVSFSGENRKNLFKTCIENFRPDVIHIWGTEYIHCNDMVTVSEQCGLLDKVIVSIQGLVSIYAKHYCLGLPSKVVYGKTFYELIKRNNIYQSVKDFENRGLFEIDTLKRVKHVIGRTDFDYAAIMSINPDLKYHFCNETLRPSFYCNEWKFENSIKHSIFVSQSNYPIKGFHFLLEALAIVKKAIPDVKVFTTGVDIRKRCKDKLRMGSYDKYLLNLLSKFDLFENVFFLGKLSEEHMLEQYLKCNVFVSPSTIENSSNSIGEAMLLGCPVISSDVGGIKSLMVDKKEGLIYQADAPYMLANLIITLFKDSKNSIELGKNARKRALITHNKDINYEKLNDMYKTISKA